MKRIWRLLPSQELERTTNRVLQILVVLSAGGLLSLNWIGHRSVEAKYLWFPCC